MNSLRNKTEFKPNRSKNRRLTLIILVATLLVIFILNLYRDRRKIIDAFLGPHTIVFFAPKTPSVLTQTLTPTPNFKVERKEIEELVKGRKGRYGVLIKDLISGDSYGVNEKENFLSASLNKLPLLLTLYLQAGLGKIDLEEKYVLRAEDKRLGAGSMQYQRAGTVYRLREMAELMGKQSDNTAFYVFLKLLGEVKIQQTVDDLGLTKTSFKDFRTTPEDIGIFFYQLYNRPILNKANRDELLSFLTDTLWEEWLPQGVPPEVEVAHKVGIEVGVISDAGIVFAKKPYILVILTEGILESEAKEILPRISALVFRQRNK